MVGGLSLDQLRLAADDLLRRPTAHRSSGHLDQSEKREDDSTGHRQLGGAGQPPARIQRRDPGATEPGSRPPLSPDPRRRGVTPWQGPRLPLQGDTALTRHLPGRAAGRLSWRDDAGPIRVPSVSAMDPTIEVAGLRKRYGATVAVDDLTFTVRPGEVTGFVGPNGAGKSTTMRIVLGLDAPDAGTALHRRPALPVADDAPDRGRRPARRRGRPSRSARPGPPAVDGPEQRPSRPSGRRGARPGGAHVGGAAAGRRVLARHATAARHRRRDAGRPAGADVRRAGERPRPRGDPMDPGIPASAGGRGAGDPRLEPPDERARGDRGPPGRHRTRPDGGGHERRGPRRRSLGNPGPAAHLAAHRRHDPARQGRSDRRRDRPRRGHRGRSVGRAHRGPARRCAGAVLGSSARTGPPSRRRTWSSPAMRWSSAHRPRPTGSRLHDATPRRSRAGGGRVRSGCCARSGPSSARCAAPGSASRSRSASRSCWPTSPARATRPTPTSSGHDARLRGPARAPVARPVTARSSPTSRTRRRPDPTRRRA